MKAKRYIVVGVLSLFLVIVSMGVSLSLWMKSQVKELFKMNKSLQEQGYYMAEFEFRMLGYGYLFGKGRYLEALRGISDYHDYLSKNENLVKIPDFRNKQEEIDFYLNLQNPETGAFMDKTAPYCTYFSNTENMLLHLEALQDSTTKPLRLKYPLLFLDEINTPEKLKAYLDDISYVNGLGARFPQTSFHFARDIFSNVDPDHVIAKYKLYTFSPEWKQTALKWMYEFQDAETGLWGPKSRKTGKLLKADINNSYSIVKKFRDTNGNNIYRDYPLRYGDKLFSATLEELKEPIPDDKELAWIHEWNLKQVKGIKMLLSFLWEDASVAHKKEAKAIISRFVHVSFEKYYVEKEGAFSYYPNSEHATVDGMTNMILKRVGALSYDKQKRYWGEPEENAKDLGVIVLDSLSELDPDSVTNIPGINSWRIYTAPPDFSKLYEHVWAVFYPKETAVFDITELVPHIVQWIETSTLSTGNWKSMADIKNEYASFDIHPPLVFRQEFPLEEVKHLMEESPVVYIVGFDILQIPGFKLRLKPEE